MTRLGAASGLNSLHIGIRTPDTLFDKQPLLIQQPGIGGHIVHAGPGVNPAAGSGTRWPNCRIAHSFQKPARAAPVFGAGRFRRSWAAASDQLVRPERPEPSTAWRGSWDVQRPNGSLKLLHQRRPHSSPRPRGEPSRSLAGQRGQEVGIQWIPMHHHPARGSRSKSDIITLAMAASTWSGGRYCLLIPN